MIAELQTLFSHLYYFNFYALFCFIFYLICFDSVSNLNKWAVYCMYINLKVKALIFKISP